MKSYYDKILLKIIDSKNEIDDVFIKGIVEVVQNINYLDAILDVTFSQSS